MAIVVIMPVTHWKYILRRNGGVCAFNYQAKFSSVGIFTSPPSVFELSQHNVFMICGAAGGHQLRRTSFNCKVLLLDR
jgi:hypothetical protein